MSNTGRILQLAKRLLVAACMKIKVKSLGL